MADKTKLSAAEIAALPYRPCVGVVLTNGAGQVFVGQRIDSEVPAWQMPQGGIDKGEDPTDAAFRELWEETGVSSDKAELLAITSDWVNYDLPEHLLGKLWKGRYRGQTQKWMLMRFNGDDRDVDITQPPAEFSVWAWKTPDEILQAIVPFKRQVYEQVFAAFEGKI